MKCIPVPMKSSQPEHDGTLKSAPSPAEKSLIIASFWPSDPPISTAFGYDVYFKEHYEGTCGALYKYGGVNPKYLVANTHEHLRQIIDAVWDLLNEKSPCTRPNLRGKLCTDKYFGPQDQSATEKLNHSINLALRLWLVMNIQEIKFSSGKASTQWDDKSTLHDFIRRQFPGPRAEVKDAHGDEIVTEKDRNTVFESNFTAANLQRIAGIKVGWTYNIQEHLMFNRKTRELLIFPLKQYLYNQKQLRPTLIPHCVIDELILSLNLLFPDGDLRSQSFLLEERQTFISEEPVDDPGRVYLTEFYHWRDRLSEIFFEFQSPPPKVKQVWTDRRNALQWWTFWFAFAIFCMTIIFGSITTVLAGLQTGYAYEQLLIARDAASSAKACPPATCGTVRAHSTNRAIF